MKKGKKIIFIVRSKLDTNCNSKFASATCINYIYTINKLQSSNHTMDEFIIRFINH